jgi:hypothetical protein
MLADRGMLGARGILKVGTLLVHGVLIVVTLWGRCDGRWLVAAGFW